MSAHALRFNEHLELETEKNPDRSYFAILRGNQPQFSPENLLAELQTETKYWMTRLTSAEATSFLQALKSIHHIFDALKNEAKVLKDVTKAMAAHSKGDWGEACKYYANALMDLDSAISDWNFAAHEIADDSPFDPYAPSKAEREKHNIEEPPRGSYQDMREISPDLFRIFRNADRVFCIGQELIQRQMTCLSTYMQEAETQHATCHAEE